MTTDTGTSLSAEKVEELRVGLDMIAGVIERQWLRPLEAEREREGLSSDDDTQVYRLPGWNPTHGMFRAWIATLTTTVNALPALLSAARSSLTREDAEADTLFALPDGSHAVGFGGRWHGWLFRRHADGYWVSAAKLSPTDPLENSPLRSLFEKKGAADVG